MNYTLNLNNYYRRHSIKYRATKAMLSLVILLLGGLVYVIYRDKSLLMFDWYDALGISNEIDGLRSLFQGEGIYGWVKYSLPDGLWAFSYMFLVDTIWNGTKSLCSYIFVYSLPTLALLSEFLQYFGLVPGVFDWMDVASYLFAILLFVTIKLIK